MYTLLSEIETRKSHSLEEISRLRNQYLEAKKKHPDTDLVYSTNKRLAHFLQNLSTLELPVPDYIIAEVSTTPVLYKRQKISKNERSQVKYKFTIVELSSIMERKVIPA